MGRILCATRGGEDSYRTQDAAVALARERGLEILYLYVVDLGFLEHTSRAVREDVVGVEMQKLGEFLLEIARERAGSQGVKAETVVRRGDLREELKRTACEYGVNIVVLGRPTEGGLYSQSEVEAFASELESETGIQAIVL